MTLPRRAVPGTVSWEKPSLLKLLLPHCFITVVGNQMKTVSDSALYCLILKFFSVLDINPGLAWVKILQKVNSDCWVRQYVAMFVSPHHWHSYRVHHRPLLFLPRVLSRLVSSNQDNPKPSFLPPVSCYSCSRSMSLYVLSLFLRSPDSHLTLAHPISATNSQTIQISLICLQEYKGSQPHDPSASAV